jgi:hypothetical protein
MEGMIGAVGRLARGVWIAVRARPGFVVAVTLAISILNVLVPPLVLSVAKKPADYFTFNPWLSNLPTFLTSGNAPLGDRLAKTWRLALFWFSSSNPYGVEWGFAVDVGDLVRMILTSLLIATYFALWRFRRDARLLAPVVVGPVGSGRAGVVGAFAGVLGLTSGPCSVMGCGAPVIPVVGLAFAGLSSSTLALLKGFSTGTTAVVVVGMACGVVGLAWRVGDPAAAR